MPLSTTIIDLQPLRTGVAVAGYPAQIIAAQAHFAALASIYPDDCAVFVGPGRSDLAALVPPQERDAGGARTFVAPNATTTRQAASNILGGLPRFAMTGVTMDGLFASLDAALTDYSMAVLARTSVLTGAQWLLGVGSTGGTRLGVYVNGANLSVQHGTGDVKTTAGSVVVANAWVPLIVSYRNSDKALQIHAGSATPLLAATMVNAPPPDLTMGLGNLPTTGVQPLTGEIALAGLWRRALHTDAAALAKMVAALNGLAAL